MEKVELFSDNEELQCELCGKNLLEDPKSSIMVVIESKDQNNELIKDIYVCCKGICDKKLVAEKRVNGFIDGWKDISELMNPILYLKNIMAFMNRLHNGAKISESAFAQYKKIMLTLAQYVMRKPTKKEYKEAEMDSSLPEGI